LMPTRAQARDAVLRDRIVVNGAIAKSPSLMVSARDDISRSVRETWVSRGAEKLIAALNAFKIEPSSRVALDIGASTGGFTEVLLRRGAERVYAIDVGTGQLHRSLRDNARVVSREKTDARVIDATVVPDYVSLIVIDVSFISLSKVLPAVLNHSSK
jgi:23S rRNA (cytidine1920-2'-O)/16S rRNA (cytidine1409-2'-O)-methyltransferase